MSSCKTSGVGPADGCRGDTEQPVSWRTCSDNLLLFWWPNKGESRAGEDKVKRKGRKDSGMKSTSPERGRVGWHCLEEGKEW